VLQFPSCVVVDRLPGRQAMAERAPRPERMKFAKNEAAFAGNSLIQPYRGRACPSIAPFLHSGNSGVAL